MAIATNNTNGSNHKYIRWWDRSYVSEGWLSWYCQYISQAAAAATATVIVVLVSQFYVFFSLLWSLIDAIKINSISLIVI